MRVAELDTDLEAACGRLYGIEQDILNLGIEAGRAVDAAAVLSRLEAALAELVGARRVLLPACAAGRRSGGYHEQV